MRRCGGVEDEETERTTEENEGNEEGGAEAERSGYGLVGNH
jgi:hypothetical protein